jgi:hypothetical protein
MLCVAPSVGGEIDGKSENVDEEFRKDIIHLVGFLRKGKQIADKYDLRFGAYEGGQGLIKNAPALSENPVVYDLYHEMLDTFDPYLEIFTHYAHCTATNIFEHWGAKQFTGEPLETAHKYRALSDWSKENNK